MSRPMWAHQIEGVERLLSTDDYMLAMEMGTGKTRTAIEALRRRYANTGRMMRTLIVCPIIVCENWKREILQYSKIKAEDIVVLTQSGSKRVDLALRQLGEHLLNNKIVITNFHGLLMDDLFDILTAWQVEILICDESQRLKSPEAKSSKRAAILGDIAKHTWLLTGTPIINSPMDLFQQFRIMDGGKTFGKNYITFRATYFRDANESFKGKAHYFPKWEPRAEAADAFRERFESRAYRVLADDCLELPEVINIRREVDLSPQQKRMYEEMKKDFITFLDDNEGKMPVAVMAEMAVTKAQRMQQIVTGFAKDENDTIHVITPNPRLAALGELLEEITPEHKVIVWAVYHENYRQIAKLCEGLNIRYAQIHGGLNAKEKEAEMELFRTDPAFRVCIANQKAGGVGINLIEARYSIYYSKGFSLEDQLQSEARNRRGGSIELHKKITRINLVAPGTIDEVIDNALSNKLKVSQAIVDWRRTL